MWRSRSEKNSKGEGRGENAARSAKRTPEELMEVPAERRLRRVDSAEQIASATFDSARSRTQRNPLESGYEVDGIELPDPTGRSVRRLNLPPLNHAGDTPIAEAVAPTVEGRIEATATAPGSGPVADAVSRPPNDEGQQAVATAAAGSPDQNGKSAAAGSLGVFGEPQPTATTEATDAWRPDQAESPEPTQAFNAVNDVNQMPEAPPATQPATPTNYDEYYENGRLKAVPDLPNNPDYRPRDPAMAQRQGAPGEQTMPRSPGLPPEQLAQPGWNSVDQRGSQQPRQWQAAQQGGNVYAAQNAFDQPTNVDAAGSPIRQGAPPRKGPPQQSAESSQKLRLASSRPPVKPKPKRANGWLLGLGLLAVVLAGLGAAYFLTRDNGDGVETAVDSVEDVDSADGVGADADVVDDVDDAAAGDDVETTDTSPAAVSPTGEPLLVMQDADTGPLTVDQAYPIEILSPPAAAQYQVIVDDLPQGNPFDVLPDLSLPAGYHTIYVEMIDGDTRTPTNVIDVHVFDDTVPPTGFRANLASIDIANEGWGEALERFKQYKADGHENLKLTPSDPYPSLPSGYWNIYVDNLGEDRAAALAYCEQAGLVVPDECFPSFFDAAAPTDG